MSAQPAREPRRRERSPADEPSTTVDRVGPHPPRRRVDGPRRAPEGAPIVRVRRQTASERPGSPRRSSRPPRRRSTRGRHREGPVHGARRLRAAGGRGGRRRRTHRRRRGSVRVGRVCRCVAPTGRTRARCRAAWEALPATPTPAACATPVATMSSRSASGMASRACGIPVQVPRVAAYARSSSVDTRSACIAMSAATTAAATEDAYRISKSTERAGIVTRHSIDHDDVVRPRCSALTWIPSCGRMSAQLVTRSTGLRVVPSRTKPLNHAAPIHRRAAQPVTAPYPREDCGSLDDPLLEPRPGRPRRAHRAPCWSGATDGPRACFAVGPPAPVGSVRTGRTSPGRGGPRRLEARPAAPSPAGSRNSRPGVVGHPQVQGMGILRDVSASCGASGGQNVTDYPETTSPGQPKRPEM